MLRFLKRYFYETLTLLLAGLTYAACNVATAGIIPAGGGALTSVQVSSALSAYPNGVSVGNSWVWTPAYEFIYVGNWPWVYNETLDIWYYNEGTSSSLWLYQPSSTGGQWKYTNADVFPWMFSTGSQSWHYYVAQVDYSETVGDGVEAIVEAEPEGSTPEPSTPSNEGTSPNTDVDPELVISPAGG